MAACCPCQEETDYYWRNYNGVVPTDALPAGEDNKGAKIYVGQVYVHELGLWVAPIYPGKSQVEFECHGVKTRDKDIKILCTRHKHNFSWLQTTATTFLTDAADKHVVEGGRTYRSVATLSIGRAKHDGVLKIGQVPNREAAYLYFVHNNQKTWQETYEVLIYNKKGKCDASN